MAYLIKNIVGYSPDQNPYYFFDSNAWIAALKHTGSRTLEVYEKQYVDFFEAIIEIHSHKGSKQEKRVKYFPKFVITSLLLSEIINAYMRNVAMKVFYRSQGKDLKDFSYKKHYRNEHDHQSQLSKLISDFMAFKDYVEIWDDQFKEIDPYSILPELNSTLDFNDFYYYYHFAKKNIPIVTHDKDFIFQDFEIITGQSEILKLI